MNLRNTTTLDTHRLEEMFRRHAAPWSHDRLNVIVRYSRGAEFSGACYYRKHQIYINIGRNNQYPYLISTHIARAQSNRRFWWKEVYTVEARDAYHLVLFIFLHEFYHWLIKRAKRNTRQKESMCDRFATRILVDAYGSVVRNDAGRPVPRESWDFQDVCGFVAGALPKRQVLRAARTVLHVPPGTQFELPFSV